MTVKELRALLDISPDHWEVLIKDYSSVVEEDDEPTYQYIMEAEFVKVQGIDILSISAS